jgi:hypothetical protein
MRRLHCFALLLVGLLCAKARSKLTRVICADADLSRLEQQVWDAYRARIKIVSPAQYAQVRDRHIAWRCHLACLTYPRLSLEGHYSRADGVDLVVAVMAEPMPDSEAKTGGTMDTQPPAALVAMGQAGALHWLPARADLLANAIEPDEHAAATRQRRAFANGGVAMPPNFIGGPQGAIQDCGPSLRWNEVAVVLATQVACGADLAGWYAQHAPDSPWPRSGRYVSEQPAP